MCKFNLHFVTCPICSCYIESAFEEARKNAGGNVIPANGHDDSCLLSIRHGKYQWISDQTHYRHFEPKKTEKNVLSIFRLLCQIFASISLVSIFRFAQQLKVLSTQFIRFPATINMNKRDCPSQRHQNTRMETFFTLSIDDGPSSYTFLCLWFRHFIFGHLEWMQSHDRWKWEWDQEFPRVNFMRYHILNPRSIWRQECAKERRVSTRKRDAQHSLPAKVFLRPSAESYLTGKCVVCHQIARYKLHTIQYLHENCKRNECFYLRLLSICFHLVWGSFLCWLNQKMKIAQEIFWHKKYGKICAISYIYVSRETSTVLIAFAEAKDPPKSATVS